MRLYWIILLSIALSNPIEAQFLDRSWIVGTGTTSKLTFNNNSIDTSLFIKLNSQIPVFLSYSNISDTTGNIIFFTNGLKVGNSLVQVMQNGDSILDTKLDSAFQNGISDDQTNLILPRTSNSYYLFYFSQTDSLFKSNTTGSPDRLYFATIDMGFNGGLGKLISKKNKVIDKVIGRGRLSACRHANGKDWWLVHQGYHTNEYYTYLVTADSIYPPHIQTIGQVLIDPYDFANQSAFSPDGSQYATVTFHSSLTRLDFDRCTGLFSNPDSINVTTDTLFYNGGIVAVCITGALGCAFSPSGRYLYASTYCGVMQYDTQADTIEKSRIMIGRWPASGGSNEYPRLFYRMALLPNGKIIIANWSGGSYNYHLIDSPDLAAPACHFSFESLSIYPSDAQNLPNMINYRLGALVGSGCDTIRTSLAERVIESSIYAHPNPATRHITIGLSQYLHNAKLYIYDMMGKEVYRNEYLYLDDDIDVSKYTTGIYQIKVTSSDGDIKGRFVKE